MNQSKIRITISESTLIQNKNQKFFKAAKQTNNARKAQCRGFCQDGLAIGILSRDRLDMTTFGLAIQLYGQVYL